MRTAQRRDVSLAALVGLAVVLVSASAWGVDTAWVARVNGTPMVERAGQTRALSRGDTVETGDVLITSAESKLKLLLADDSVLAIGPSSRVTIDALALEPTRRSARLRVLAGRFKLAIAKFFGGSSDYEVHLPTAVAGVRGTVLWGDTELDTVCALDGHIEVRPLAGELATKSVPAGMCVRQMGEGKTTAFRPSREDLANYLEAVTLD